MADNRLLPYSVSDESGQAMNELIDRLGSIDITPLMVYLIDNVVASALPHFAEQFHVMGGEGWQAATTDDEKRKLIRQAIALHRKKGTPWAIESACAVLNHEVKEIMEWFQYDGNPYRFKVFLQSGVYDEATYLKIIAAINAYKNARSWLDSVGVHREQTNQLNVAMAARNGKHYKIGLRISIAVENANLYTGCMMRTAFKRHIGVASPEANIDTTKYYYGFAFRTGRKTTIHTLTMSERRH